MDNNTSTINSFKHNETPRLEGTFNCRACGTHITFKKLGTGRSIPLEDDSNVHRCAQWKSWRVGNG